MVATDQENEIPEEGSSSELDRKPAEGGKSPQDALVDEVTKQRAKKRAEAERAEKAEAALAEAQKKIEALQNRVQEVSSAEELTKQVAALRAESEMRKVSMQFGTNEEQSQLILENIQKMGMGAEDAFLWARTKNPEKFTGEVGSGFDASMHGSLGTTRGAQPQAPADDTEKRVKRIKDLEGVDQMKADRLRNNMIGGMAARAMGIAHHPIPID